MNTNRALQSLTLLAATILNPAVGNASEAAPEAIRVFIVDDQTGEELRARHGIQPLQVSDLVVLVDAVLLGRTPVHLVHQAVDEDATDNGIAQMVFKPFAGGPAPVAPRPNMPLRQLTELSKQFQTDRLAWQRKIAAYRRDVELGAQAFIQSVGEAQVDVAQRFDRMLEVRNGRDFNRSDIVGSVTAANRILGTTGRRVLILNTDADDLPAKRQPRRIPLTATELDPEVQLIFVNTSRLPEQAVLFAGVQNPIQHADSIKEALELVVAMLAQPERPSRSAAAR